MASKKTQIGMVKVKEGSHVTAPPDDYSSTSSVIKGLQKPQNSGTVQVTLTSSKGKDFTSKCMYVGKDTNLKMGQHKKLPSLRAHSDILSPDSICEDVKVTLENNSMWNEFFRCQTEMILTKQGSRMFPYCRFRISGLQPSKIYDLIMDIQPVDSSQYKWTGENWQVSSKAESPVKSKPFVHPESPATGQHWMQNPVSFYRLKLTNNISDQEENMMLHPMHRYLPRLHIIQADRGVEATEQMGHDALTFTFPQTEFITVTTYQNPNFVQLKVNHNPFVKGLREDGLNLCGLKPKANASKHLNKHGGNTNIDQDPMKKGLKFLLENHKQRHLKAWNSNLSPPEDLQKNPKTNPSSTGVPGKNSSNSLAPASKLISELICEAHVSLQRCSMEQIDVDHSTSREVTQSNTKTLSSSTLTDSKKLFKNNLPVTTVPRKKENVDTNSKIKLEIVRSRSSDSKDNIRPTLPDAVEPTRCQTFSKQPSTCNFGNATETLKKNPPRLPLPALALFLKRHSTKSKKENKLNSVSLKPSADSPSDSCIPPSSIVAPDSEDRIKPIIESNTNNHTEDTEEWGLKSIIPSVETENFISSNEGPVDPPYILEQKTTEPLTRISETLVSDLTFINKPLLTDLENVFCTDQESKPSPSASTTSPPSPLHFRKEFSCSNAMKAIPEPNMAPSDSSSKIECLLPDPSCSAFDFDPLSPASSPEPILTLPSSLALELDSTPSIGSSAEQFVQDPHHSKNLSVFKWHTVLPPSKTPMDNSFTCKNQQPPSPLMSPTSPSLAGHSNSSASQPLKDTPFLESEPVLHFPLELSPLALQIPLSPTFSSLHEDVLSPTPSISELVKFFTTDDNMGVEKETSNSETAPGHNPTPPAMDPSESSQHEQPLECAENTTEPDNEKKASKETNCPRLETDGRMDYYKKMEPSLEEVDHQLFISFSSKEALNLHISEFSEELMSQTARDVQQTPEEPESINADCLEEKIDTFQKILLRDLKLMKYRQVIHPVLQEVGLKMALLDPSLSVDLKYLGVLLPIPPPGTLEPENQTSSSQGVSTSFLSRTGKTTDLTQIKGWREKFTSPEPAVTSVSSPRASPSSDVVKKNMSAFCSDMLDKYLEDEGNLIYEQASSFSQTPVEPISYNLPINSASYVPSLDQGFNKRTAEAPASDLLTGFVPPSKRPRLKQTTQWSRARKKHTHSKEEPRTQFGFQKRTKYDHSTLKQALSPSRPLDPQLAVSEDPAPLSPVSEPMQSSSQKAGVCKLEGRPLVTRALLRQKDLEDLVICEGSFRTTITEERAGIALSALFTSTGFVTEDPTAPVKIAKRRAVHCLNEFCRLGCICSCLSHCVRISHCGHMSCMFGCNCLKQKVVLLKNLESSDSSSPSSQGKVKMKKRRRRMKMAYVLKEAESVSQPAERIHTLWRKEAGDSDPEPVHIPHMAAISCSAVNRMGHSSCARVRGNKKWIQKNKISKEVKLALLKSVELKNTNKANICNPKSVDSSEPNPPKLQSPPTNPTLKPSKRLLILASCKWSSASDRTYVLKKLCESMAREQLAKPFWIKKYLVTPVEETVEGSGANQCIQYKVQISSPQTSRQKVQEKVVKQVDQRNKKTEELKKQEHPLNLDPKQTVSAAQKVNEEGDHLEDWQREIFEEPEASEGINNVMEETGPLEACQKDEKKSKIEGERNACSTSEAKLDKETVAEDATRNFSLTAPFVTRIGHTGLLSAQRKQPGGLNNVIKGSELSPQTTSSTSTVLSTTASTPITTASVEPPLLVKELPLHPVVQLLRSDGSQPSTSSEIVMLQVLASSAGTFTPSLITSSNKNHVLVTGSDVTSSYVSQLTMAQGTFSQDTRLPVANLNSFSIIHSSQKAELATKTTPVPFVIHAPEDRIVKQNSLSQQSQPTVESLPGTHLTAFSTQTELSQPNHLSPKQEPACNIVDLDIICVDDVTGFPISHKQTTEVVDLISTSETENSSDFKDSGSEEENQNIADKHRTFHNFQERKRRAHMQQRFNDLQKAVTPSSEKISKVSTLKKAQILIRDLKSTEEHLKKKKRWLKKKRDRYLSNLSKSPGGKTEASLEVVDLASNLTQSPEEKATNRESTKSVPKLPASSGQLIPSQQQLDFWVLEKMPGGGETTPQDADKQQLLLQQKMTQVEEIHQAAGNLPGESGTCVAPLVLNFKDNIVQTCDTHWTPEVPASDVLGITPPAPFTSDSLPQVIEPDQQMHGLKKQPKRIPNILSRMKPPAVDLFGANVVSLATAPPGQAVMSLGHLNVGNTVLQTPLTTADDLLQLIRLETGPLQTQSIQIHQQTKPLVTSGLSPVQLFSAEPNLRKDQEQASSQAPILLSHII